MKKIIIYFLALAPLLFLNACSKDEAAVLSPTIKLLYLGSHDEPDSRIAFLNEAIHFEANISAPAKIQKITLEFQKLSGYANYSITHEYIEGYVGQSEIPSFHDHPVIDSAAGIGTYKLILTVYDQAGQQAKLEEEFEVKEGQGGSSHVHTHE